LTDRKRIVFLDEGSTCDVESVHVRAPISSSRVREVTVTNRTDDLYEVLSGGLLVLTSSCLNLAAGEDAILRIDPLGTGSLYFVEDENSCEVKGIYAQTGL
jgi:hypothetical protein